MDQDILWIEKPRILWDMRQEFFPIKGMQINRFYNAIVRYFLYTAIIMLIFNIGTKFVLLLLIMIIFVTYIGYKQKKQKVMDECRETTLDNPLKNVLIFDNTEIKACEKNDASQIEDNLRYNLYEDSYSPFIRNYINRTFYTLPATSFPNDRKSFLEFTYRTSDISAQCKSNQVNCESYRDPRFKR